MLYYVIYLFCLQKEIMFQGNPENWNYTLTRLNTYCAVSDVSNRN